MSENKGELRKTPRVKRQFMIRYRSATMERVTWQVAPLRDFSRTGARFLSERHYDAGHLLKLQLMLPMSQQPLNLTGRIAWTKPVQLNMVELGVTFDAADPGINQMLNDAAAHFLQKQVGG